MNKLQLFVPLAKVDEAKREVWGVLAEERVDKVNEIFDYEGSKPYFQKWSKEIEKASRGKSLGNLRAMHGKVAAGKFVSLDFNDTELRIDVGAKVIDDNEWKKCDEGVYTGFSIGANVVKAWKDGETRRYIADPVEGSLVDNPCMYGAHFTAVKAAGVEEERKFRGGIVQVWACVDTGRHMHTEKAAAIGCLQKTAGGVAKSLYTVADICALLACLNSCRLETKWEAEYEGDDSPIPDLLAQEVRDLTEILIQLLEEEASELLGDLKREEVAAMAPAEFQKFLLNATARFTGAQIKDARTIIERALTSIPEPEDEMTKEEIQKLVDEVVTKAIAANAEKVVGGELVAGALVLEGSPSKADFEKLEKRFAESEAAREELSKQISEDVVGAIKALTETVCDLEKRTPKATDPAPLKGAMKVVAKTDDTGEPAKVTKEAPKPGTPEATAEAVEKVKESWRRPIAVGA